MSHHDNELDNTELTDSAVETTDKPCAQRRRLLTMLGVGIVTAYVAPTLFSVGEAQAWDRYERRNKHDKRGKRGSYSRASYSRSSYDNRGRERSRLRDYQNDPVLILEDVILGPPRR